MERTWLAAGLLGALACAGGPAGAAQTNAPKAPTTPVKLETIAKGLEHPWALAHLPDGRFLVTERPGHLRIVGKDGKLSAPVKGVPAVHAKGQGGLLDVVLAPDFQTSGRIFLSYAEPRENGLNNTAVASGKLVLEGEGGRLDDVKVVFRQSPSWKGMHHFGSRLVFDREGAMFVTTGERFSGKDEAQNPASELGKVIRIMPTGEPAPGNPSSAGWDPKVWSIGHRNIQGAALDPATGQLWTIEHGARGGDELNHPEPGKNYGWPVISYGVDYSGAKIGIGTAKEGMEQPVYYWDPSIAVSGLTIYSGDLFSGWKGNMLIGGLKTGGIQRLVLNDGAVAEKEDLSVDIGERVRDVRQGPDGALYVLTDEPSGRLLRISPSG